MTDETTSKSKTTYPVLALRDFVVFPRVTSPLFVGRPRSVRALQEVANTDRQLMLLSQRVQTEDDPGPEGLYEVGTLATVVQLIKLPDGTFKVNAEGTARARVTSFTDNVDFLEVEVEELPDENADEARNRALTQGLLDSFTKLAKASKSIPSEILEGLHNMKEPSAIADVIASNLTTVQISDRQELLEMTDVGKRLERTLAIVENEIDISSVQRKIKGRIRRQMERSQREYYLNEQMKAIQRELGEGEGGRDELAELGEKIRQAKLPKEANERAEAELKKLWQTAPISAEATVLRNYLDWLVSLPWHKESKVRTDLSRAERILNADHYGLEKIKERIIEYLAVQRRTGVVRGPILCLVGPPGVGKTSLGKSMAKATGREFVRIALGGVRDEAEIRGHRRTYVGALPGKVIHAMRRAKTVNPLIMFDEIDKMGIDFRGDPSSAMLEVLDPEQNSTFSDHYLELEYDLSKVLFVTTANTLNMSPPLRDRMEVLELAGYTENEKIEIAKRHLIPKQFKAHGLKAEEVTLRREALREIIRTYTREAGVRNLERDIAKLCRKAVTKITKKDAEHVNFSKADLGDYLGVPKFRYGMAERKSRVGVVTGLAYTETGGDLLSIEAVRLPGRGQMKATGKLGKVMKESIEAAASYVRANAADFGVSPEVFNKLDIHVHVPEGAIPKDGPSAGVGMVTAIVSVLTGIPVRRDVAMTGEVTLRGDVLGIGGLKEKLLAALRGGVRQVIIPEETAKFLIEIPDNVKEGLSIIPVSNVRKVLNVALEKDLEPIEWDEDKALARITAKESAATDDTLGTTH